MNQRSIFVGIHLNNQYTQLAVMGPMDDDPVLLPEETGGEIPTDMELSDGGHLTDFVKQILHKEPIEIKGVEAAPVQVLTHFLRKVLYLVKQRHPYESIRQVVVVTPHQNVEFIDLIYKGLENLGIARDYALVADYKQSLIHYIMSQKKEYWVNEVGCFEYEGDHLTYRKMKMKGLVKPYRIEMEERDYSENESIFKDANTMVEEKAKIFESMVQGAIHDSIITTLYMTGKRCEEEFITKALQNVSRGRYVFQGNNLYVLGACYRARQIHSKDPLQDYIYLDENMITCRISMMVYTEGKVREIELVPIGVPWHQVDKQLDLIPDGDTEFVLMVEDLNKESKSTRIISMEPVEGKVMRQTRIGVRIRFATPRECIVTLRDKGFGDIYPSSYRAWEETIQL